MPAPQAPAVWSFTDLDGDLTPDRVRSTAVGADRQGFAYSVEFEMSAGRASAPIAVHAGNPWGLRIMPRDVDGDHDLDLVVTSGEFGEAVDVWINDGQGGFTSGGVYQFPASIWFPGQSLAATGRVPVQAMAFVVPGFMALLRPDAPYRECTAQAWRRRSDAAVPVSSPLSNARPRAPPAL
jgi:VCBS repeat protein